MTASKRVRDLRILRDLFSDFMGIYQDLNGFDGILSDFSGLFL